MRRVIIAGNWKMHKTVAETRALLSELVADCEQHEPHCEVLVAPPFTSLAAATAEVRGTLVQVGGQNLHWEDRGAFTGEVSGPMLKDLGCSHVIVGHSERRQYFGETDRTVNLRIKAAMRNDLVPIFCLGETLDEREQGKTFEVVRSQVQGGLSGIGPVDPGGFVVAYEPVWAIGTGRTASPAQAQEVHAYLRNELGNLLGEEFATHVRILYGGSVRPDNARSLMECEDIDGALVGGASLKAGEFIGIIREGS
jgi:triosephosphate isomerase